MVNSLKFIMNLKVLKTLNVKRIEPLKPLERFKSLELPEPMKPTAIIISFFFTSCSVFAQADIYPGTWVNTTTTFTDSLAVYFEMKIAEPENKILYPAQIKIETENFEATYQVLLVKKNDGQLAIGRNKFPENETPFSLGAWTILLNGTFDLSSDEKGNALLTAHRIPARRYGFTMPAIISFAEASRSTAMRINDFLKDAPIQLQKINKHPWQSAAITRILNTYQASSYFGIVDTLYTKSADAELSFLETNKPDNDTVSVMLNGKMIIDKMNISQRDNLQKIKLDTGLNILCFFADNYGKVPPNTGKLNLAFSEKKILLDFTSLQNMSATFIVAKIYFYPDQKQMMPSFIIARNAITQKIKQRETKQIDSIKATSPEITLAIWDDAVEDGDSISLQINNEIFLPGISVKKKPQFIKVKLYAGENKIIFIADNLGSIAPNTSILEIIDGKKRKSYMINTNLGKNNSIKILYEAEGK